MIDLRHRSLWCVLAWSTLGLVFTACSSDIVPISGECHVDAALTCGVSLDGSTPTDAGLVGYSCVGGARPDLDARYEDGVPEGLVCAAVPGTGDSHGYCCSPNKTPCAYNPVAACDSGTYGYQCRGSSRPEALNPAISCGNGVEQGDYINYCCSGESQPSGCTQKDTVGCSPRLTGFECTGSNLPKGEQLGQSESRADYYRPLCRMPALSPSGKVNTYCCYMPALVPVGGSCVQDVHVPGCAAGRFGFACYGPDSPDQDYAPMHCPAPGFGGTSDEDYPATLYCCDFE